MKSDKSKIVFFIVSFFTLWSLRIFIVPRISYVISYFTISVILKFLIFVVYPFMFIKLCYKENPIDVLFLRKKLKKSVLYWLIALTVICIGLLVYMQLGNTIELNQSILKKLFIVFVYAGFMEEVVFRGLILGKLTDLIGFQKASIISALLFVLIQVPELIVEGRLLTSGVLVILLYVFVFSIINNRIVRRLENLWLAMILHVFWDLVIHIIGF